MSPLHTVNRPSNVLPSDALPFVVEPFSKVSSRHRLSLGTVVNESGIWCVQSVSFQQSRGQVWALIFVRPLKRGSISKRTKFGWRMKAGIMPPIKCRGISTRYVNNPSRGEGSQDRSPPQAQPWTLGISNTSEDVGIVPRLQAYHLARAPSLLQKAT